MTDSPAPARPAHGGSEDGGSADGGPGPGGSADGTGRRGWLGWAARGLYAACAAAVAWPAAKFFGSPLAAEAAGPVTDRAVRLADLAPGVPKLVPITGESRDAWTRYPAVTVGRAWVVRTSPEDVPPAEAQVSAFSSVCPHAGCQVSGTVPGEPGGGGAVAGLLCPCHGAVFAVDGEALPLPDGRPNPSPRGLDELKTEVVEADGDWWVEVQYVRYRPGVAEQIEV